MGPKSRRSYIAVENGDRRLVLPTKVKGNHAGTDCRRMSPQEAPLGRRVRQVPPFADRDSAPFCIWRGRSLSLTFPRRGRSRP